MQNHFLQSLWLREPEELDHGILSWMPQDTELHPVKQADIDAYNYRSQAFDAKNPPKISARDAEALKPLLSLAPTATILELGGGDGRFGHHLMREGFTCVIESDISAHSVAHAARVASQEQLPGAFCVIDSEHLPFKDNSLDAVFMVASLHHVPSALRVIEEMTRVLRPGGTIAILREPASWQYYVFYPLFKLIKWMVRRNKTAPVSIADDVTFGFTKRYFEKTLHKTFSDIRVKPVHYTRKLYTNIIDLANRVLRKKYAYSEQMMQKCERIDSFIARIPFLRSLAWDWDIYATKK